MDAQTKLKLILGEMMITQVNLASQLEIAQEQVKLLQEELKKVKENGADTSN